MTDVSERALLIAREVVAVMKEADDAHHTAALCRAGEYDSITEIRLVSAGVEAGLRDILAGQSVGDDRRPDGPAVEGDGRSINGELHIWRAAGWYPATPAPDSPAMVVEDYNGNRPNYYIPPLPKGMKLLAVDTVIGAFAYINHAGTWQGMPNPLPTPASHTAPDADDWLLRQLEAWPTRVDPDKTTNVEYIMQEAAKRIRALAIPAPSDRGEIERATKAIQSVWQNYSLPIGQHLFEQMALAALNKDTTNG